MTVSEQEDGRRTNGRTGLELLRLIRLAGEYDTARLEFVLSTARQWLTGQAELQAEDTGFLVEALFKCGRLVEAAQVTKQRLARGESATTYDDFALQYQRLSGYDFALPPVGLYAPVFPPRPAAAAVRVLSLYHSSITFQTSGYTVRTQALLANSKIDVVPLTRVGYPWAAKLAKSALPKVGKRNFETSSESVRYRHRHGLVTNQSQTFANIALGKHEILKALCETRPHVVHAASNFVNGLPGLLAARAAGLPFVYEMRGLWELTAGVGIPGWLESERYALERRIETFVAQNAERVIVLSHVQKRELAERGVDPAKIRVVINGHDPQRVVAGRSTALLAQHCPGLSEWIAGRTVIGYAGAVAVYEGLQDLIATLAERREAWSDVAVIIAGDGPYLLELTAQVVALGLESRVKLLGRVPSEVADALYGVVDVCILPRRPDAVSQLITPLKTVEILSHGKVLLASNVGAIAEQVARYGFGETFVAGDRRDMERQLERILGQLSRLKERYAQATARIADGFTWANIAQEWDAVMNEVAATSVEQPPFPPASRALAPLYDDAPMRLREPLPLWRRIARSSLLVESDYSWYLRYPAPLDGRLRLVAILDGAEIAQVVRLGPLQNFDGYALRDLRSLPPGKYQIFLYVPVEMLTMAAARDSFSWMQAPDPWNPNEVSESRIALRWERRQFLACELEHDAKNPTELDVYSEHASAVKVAASYIPLSGAELNSNFIQRTKSKVTGTRFHYISIAPGNSELQLFPRMSGRLMVELTPWADNAILENQLRQVARVRTVPRDASLFPNLDRSRTNVLVAANVNETLLDGSTIWLKTLANTLASLPGVNVYVATNAVHVSNGVTAELFDKPNVAKIDLVATGPDRAADMANQLRMLDRTAGGFDLIVMRGLDFAKGFVDRSNRDRTVYYGVGMFRRAPDGALQIDEAALNVAAKCSGIIFQNEEMQGMFAQQRPAYAGKFYGIPPCVESGALAAAASAPLPVSSAGEQLVVYTGKLIREYGVLELVQAVQQRLEQGKPTRLVILGNKLDARDPSYQEELEAALQRLGQAVTWLPAVAPSVALSWARRADAVWGWRHGDFETSHFEISTKMVEAICCGTPIVLYPAPANVALMGSDYAGFGEQESDAARALERLLAAGRAAFSETSERLRGRFHADRAYRPLLERVAGMVQRRSARSIATSKPSILVAGHDFRFIEDIEAYALRDGHVVTREYWKNHTVRYVHGQASAAEDADIVFCEWCLGNAVWWSNNLPAGKRLFIRLHLQEIHTPHPGNVDWSRVEKLIFISPQVMREAIAKFGIPEHKCQVIPISVRLNPGAPIVGEALARRRDTLGMVGLTPWRKRPDKALELLLALRERYPNLRLHLKGHTPSEYAWMSTRKDELAQYQQFFRALGPLERAGVVQVSGYDDQLEAFYRDVGWVLSLSDFEGCHTAVAEGGVMGCLPLMTNWGGADEVYSAELVQADLAGVQRYFDDHYASFEEHSRRLSERFEAQFGLDQVFEQWRRLFARGSAADGASAVERQQLVVDGRLVVEAAR